MRSEPDFELLPPPRVGTGWRVAFAISAACAAAACVACVIFWSLQREARSMLERSLASPQQVLPRSLPPEPAYAAVAREAAKLMQHPIDGWLRELERCQPERARTRELRVDARAGRVVAQVELQGELALSPWLQCLNAGLASPVWRTAQAGAAADGATPLSATGRPAWTVVLERVESW
jgi:hypothetical protein